jgi:hypothetical protein
MCRSVSWLDVMEPLYVRRQWIHDTYCRGACIDVVFTGEEGGLYIDPPGHGFQLGSECGSYPVEVRTGSNITVGHLVRNDWYVEAVG